QDIMFNNNKVSGGTLEALVERLTLHDQAADMDFTKAFLLCFRCFCPPQHLLNLLIERFTLQPPNGLTNEEKEEWHTKKLVPLRLRVFNITKSWLEVYFIPEEDSIVLDDMKEFVAEVVSTQLPAVANRLMRLITQRVSIYHLLSSTAVNSSMPLGSRVGMFGQSSSSDSPGNSETSSSITSSILSSKKAPNSVLAMDANEIANQLTLMDSKLFCAITPRELIGQEFSKKEGSLAVNVKAMSTLSTQVTTWVAENILYENDIKKRVALIKHFIKVGDRCLQLKNYNSVFAIFSALNSSNVQRLKRTWKSISNRAMTSFYALSRACDCTRNFAAYRARLKQELPPCLPFMGVYLTDLTFIEDGNAKLKRCTTATHIMINFSKYLKTVQLLNEIQRFQVMPYPMAEVSSIQNSMRKWFDESITGGDQETLYQASLRLEPREG
ncbi:ras guanine nucleotide exchange factor domain-containing protein, partial [Syncephalis fuscata]